MKRTALLLGLLVAAPLMAQTFLGRALQGAKTADLRGAHRTLSGGRVKITYDFSSEQQLLDFATSDPNAFKVDQGNGVLTINCRQNGNFLFFREPFSDFCEMEVVLRAIGQKTPSLAMVMLAKEPKPYPAPAYYLWLRNGIDPGGHAIERGKENATPLQVQQSALFIVNADPVMHPEKVYKIYAKRETNRFMLTVNGMAVLQGRERHQTVEQGFMGLVFDAGQLQISDLWVAGHLKRIQ